jgi:hypothetical protein
LAIRDRRRFERRVTASLRKCRGGNFVPQTLQQTHDFRIVQEPITQPKMLRIEIF